MRLLLALAAIGIPAFSQDPVAFFESRVRPVLAKNCYPCHTKSEMGGLRVDSRARILHGGKSGPAIVAGTLPKASSSALWNTRIRN